MQLEKVDGRIEQTRQSTNNNYPAGCSVDNSKITFNPIQYDSNKQLIQGPTAKIFSEHSAYYNALQPVCKKQNNCGRIVLRGKGVNSNKAYVFNFGGGTNGESSIARATLSNPIVVTGGSGSHDKDSCLENGKLDGDCCAEKRRMSCKTGTTLTLKDSNGDLNKCWTKKTGLKNTKGECTTGDTCAFRYTCEKNIMTSTITSLTVKASAVVPDFNACVSSDTAFPFWVRVDTYGHAAMGEGGKVGVNTMLKWLDPDPIQYVHNAGFGSVSSSEKLAITKVEVNRGYKEEVYCWPPNNEEDPDKEDFNDLGSCYRKMPDSYLNTAPLNNVRTNPQGAVQLKCNKGGTLDPLYDACISGVCKDFGIGVLRCTGCADDRDCGKRTYIGKDCNAPGTRVLVRQSNGLYYGADVQDFDGPSSKGWGAPNNGNIRVKGGNIQKSVPRTDVYSCAGASRNYKSSRLPSGCETSCAISGTQCPLEQPSSPGMEPDTCWDGSHKKGNRGVCVFEERDGLRWGPRKFFCSAPGYAGAWCKQDKHCGSGSVCSLWRCTKPKQNYEICASDNGCISGKCYKWWGLTKKCAPKDGFKDREHCFNDSACKSKSCVKTFGEDKRCKPNRGWKKNEQCTSSSHCEKNMVHDKAACRENGNLDGDCCAEKKRMSCKTGTTLTLKDSNGDLNRCWTQKTGLKDTKGECTTGDTCAFRYTCEKRAVSGGVLECAVGRCKQCTTGITKHKQWKRMERGTCAYGCCNNDGSARSMSKRCTTGITKDKQWSKPVSGTCQYGCCTSGGYAKSFGNKCNGIPKGGKWSFQESYDCSYNTAANKRCSYWPHAHICWDRIRRTCTRTISGKCLWGCCKQNGHDRGYSQHCSTGITTGKAWSRTDTGKCEWGCCKNNGHDNGWQEYCPSDKLSTGQKWEKLIKGTCVWGCCNNNGYDNGWN